MSNRLITVMIAGAIALCGSNANADGPKEIKAESGKPVILGNFLNTPANCGSKSWSDTRAKTSRKTCAWRRRLANCRG